MDPGSVSGSGSHLYEPRLARLRLRVFEPMDIINHKSYFIDIVIDHYLMS